MDYVFIFLFFAYIPLQIAFLVLALMNFLRKPRTKKRILWGSVCAFLFVAMLPFSYTIAALLLIWFSGGSFGA